MKKEYVKPESVVRDVRVKCYMQQVSKATTDMATNTEKAVDNIYGIDVSNEIWGNNNLDEL